MEKNKTAYDILAFSTPSSSDVEVFNTDNTYLCMFERVKASAIYTKMVQCNSATIARPQQLLVEVVTVNSPAYYT